MITPVLRVFDIDLSLAFYTKILGFRGAGGLPGLDGKTVYAEAYLGDARIMFSRRVAGYNRWLFSGTELYLMLPDSRDLDTFYADLIAREVCVTECIHVELWGDRAFTIIDLDGNRLTFTQSIRYPIHVHQPSLKHIA